MKSRLVLAHHRFE